jgi:hypothetical protein
MTRDIRFSPLMIAVIEVMLDDPDREYTRDDLAAAITANEALRPAGILKVIASQLTPPLGQLRRMKWVLRHKREIGMRRFWNGNAHVEYPEIKRYYSLVPGRAALWREISQLLDHKGNVSSADVAKCVENLKEGTAIVDNRSTVDEPEYVPPKEPFFKLHTIMDEEIRGGKKYMTRLLIGRLRLHIFHRGDNDADPHDHPWDFWTFPLRSYVEEVLYPVGGILDSSGKHIETKFAKVIQVVPAFRWSFRKAEHRHRVLGRFNGRFKRPVKWEGDEVVMWDSYAAPATHVPFRSVFNGTNFQPDYDTGKIITIVWRGKFRREWGFWKSTAGRWCWQVYRKYIWEGGRNEPCGD